MFGEFFANYSGDRADNRTVILPGPNSYLTPHDLETPIFEKV